jgi:thiamine biosynthesis lipoprotein ApbE
LTDPRVTEFVDTYTSTFQLVVLMIILNCGDKRYEVEQVKREKRYEAEKAEREKRYEEERAASDKRYEDHKAELKRRLEEDMTQSYVVDLKRPPNEATLAVDTRLAELLTSVKDECSSPERPRREADQLTIDELKERLKELELKIGFR